MEPLRSSAPKIVLILSIPTRQQARLRSRILKVLHGDHNGRAVIGEDELEGKPDEADSLLLVEGLAQATTWRRSQWALSLSATPQIRPGPGNSAQELLKVAFVISSANIELQGTRLAADPASQGNTAQRRIE
uniref:Response regulatory domain-containing protein n=1 Tax=Steinernema glaseri TaxID=37863 RepID=A0A1I7ZJI0_9BILA